MWNLFWDKKYAEVRDAYAVVSMKHQHSIHECNEKKILPKDFWRDLTTSGLYEHSINSSETDGIVYLAAAVEGLCYGSLDGGTAISLLAHLGLGLSVISIYANDGLKKKMMDRVINDGCIISFATTEPHGGSDPTKLQTNVVKNGEYYILNGEKWCITNAPFAGIIITFAREVETKKPVAIILEREFAGIEITTLSPIGLKSSPIGKIKFNNVRVPVANILGNIGGGLEIMNYGFTRERLFAPFAATGMMARVLDDTFKYAHERSVFDEKIGTYQFIKHRLTEMKLSLDTTQSLGHAALKSYVTNGGILGIASAAKMYSANQSLKTVEHAIRILGSYGIQEGSVGDLLTSAMAGVIAGGTEEIHREAIYQDLYLSYRKKLRK